MAIKGSPYCVYAKEDPRLTEKRQRKSSSSGKFYYAVILTPVCHHHQPTNDNELCSAINAILNALQLLHNQGTDCMFLSVSVFYI